MSAPSWAGMSTGESSCTPHLVKEIKRESGSQSDGAYDVDFDTLGQSSRCSQSHSRSLLLGSERYDSSKGGSRGAEGKLVHSFKNKNYSSLRTPSFPTKTLLLTQNSFIPYKNPHSGHPHATRMHTPPRGTPLLPDSDHPDSSVWTLEPERPSGATTGKVAILTALGVEPRTARALSFVGRSLNHLVKVSL